MRTQLNILIIVHKHLLGKQLQPSFFRVKHISHVNYIIAIKQNLLRKDGCVELGKSQETPVIK